MPLLTIPIHEHGTPGQANYPHGGGEPWRLTKAEFIRRRGADAPVEREDFARYHLSKVSTGAPGLSVESGTLDGKPIRKVIYRTAKGVPVGVTTLRTAAGEKVLDDTAVHPDYQRQGIATQLYRKAAELGHTAGWAENVGSAGVKHKLAVADALRAGKMVPDRVLADYPELRKRVREHGTPGEPNYPHGMALQTGGSGAWSRERTRITSSRRATKSAMRPATDAERKRLAIPPKYTDVMVAVDPKAELRATAITPAGKTASYYSKAYTERQEAAKWSRVMALQRVMPALVAKIEKDSTNPKSPNHERAMALRLIALTGLRNGGEGKGLKESFGATSLRMEHVTVSGNSVRLTFPGKSGVAQDLVVLDAPLAAFVKARQATGAETLFTHDSGETLAYMKKISGGKFKVHDLRTWNGTVMADRLVSGLLKAGLTPKTKKEFKALRKQVATQVANALGNTPAMALSTYIHPAVFRPLEL